MAATIKDVAKLAGVSVATASRTIGNYGYASKETRKKVLFAMEQLKYRPNIVAKSLVKNKTKSIGLLVTDIENPFFIRLIKEVDAKAKKEGYSIIFNNSDEDAVKEEEAIHSMISRHVDGLIIVPVGCDARSPDVKKSKSHFSDLISQNIPFVFMDRELESIDTDTVSIENELIAYRVTFDLLERESPQIALIIPDQQITSITRRYNGFARAFRDHHINLDKRHIIFSKDHAEMAYQAVSTYLDNAGRDTQVFFTLDYQMTLGTLAALHKKRRDDLGSVHVVCFDQLGLIDKITDCYLTVIEQPVEELARIAVDRLINRIERPREHMNSVIIKLNNTAINHNVTKVMEYKC